MRYACGVDAAQALILALSMVGATLYCSEEYEDGRIKWFPNSRDANLGFPVSENIRDVLPGQKQPWDSGQGNLF